MLVGASLGGGGGLIVLGFFSFRVLEVNIGSGGGGAIADPCVGAQNTIPASPLVELGGSDSATDLGVFWLILEEAGKLITCGGGAIAEPCMGAQNIIPAPASEEFGGGVNCRFLGRGFSLDLGVFPLLGDEAWEFIA